MNTPTRRPFTALELQSAFRQAVKLQKQRHGFVAIGIDSDIQIEALKQIATTDSNHQSNKHTKYISPL